MMANPVTLDFAVAKTLLAFGERAVKHGLAIPEDLQQFIDEPGKMVRLVNYAKAGAPFYEKSLPNINWPLTYEKLGMAGKLIPLMENSALWVVPTVPGITPNKVVAAYRELQVDVYTYCNDLDANVTENDRDPKKDGPYVIGCRRTLEADAENANKSANQLAIIGHKGITLCERLLLGFGYYVTTGQHLDEKNVTLCTGSRCGDGGVPDVNWNADGREVGVSYCSPGGFHDDLRSRSVVSLPVEQA